MTRNGPLLTFFELLTLVALPLSIVAVAVHETQDPLTPVMLAVVLGVWLFYEAAGRRWLWFGRERRAESDRKGSLQLRLATAARQRSFTVDGVPHLEPGEAQRLVDEHAESSAGWNLPQWLSSGQGLLIALGLAGTFLGLTMGLRSAAPGLSGDEAQMQDGMVALLNGAKLAFAKSLAGVWCGAIWGMRYRWLEESHRSMLQDHQDWLNEAFPPLSTQQVLIHHLGAQQRQLDGIHDALRGLDALLRVTDTARGLGEKRLAEMVVSERRQLGADLATALSTTADKQTTRALAEIGDLMNGLAESLPERIGANAGLALTTGLQPSFDDLSRALGQLSSAGGQAIGDALQASIGGEVVALRNSLAEVVARVQEIGPRVTGEMEAELAAHARGGSDILGLLQQLARVSLHPRQRASLESAEDADRWAHESARTRSLWDALLRYRHEGAGVLIFVRSLAMQETLQRAIGLAFSLRSVPVLNGRLPMNQRHGVVDEVRRAVGFRVLIVSPDVGGAGWNLQFASRAVMLERPYNPAVEAQMVARIHRLGQTVPVEVLTPVAITPGLRTFDEILDGLLTDKRNLSEAVLAPISVSDEEVASRFSSLLHPAA